jgi:hypothetical protein
MKKKSPISPHRIAPHRRGSAYILVMGIALLLTVIGMGTLLTTRLAGRQSSNASDWQQAGLLAQSMVEQAISYLNAQIAANPTTWRNEFTSYTTGSTPAFSQTTSVGIGTWVVKDEFDGNFTNNYADPFRLYGIAKVGQTTRVYSVQVVPAGSPLDVLRCAMHCNTDMSLNGTTIAGNGPLSSNTKTNTTGQIYGNVETVTQSGPAGAINGTLTINAPIKPMPSAALFNIYNAKATPITNFPNGGTISYELITAANNPYGTENPEGIYSINVSGGNKTLTINCSRIIGTLVITLGNKGTLNLTGPVLWEPARPDYPILIVKSSNNNATINITGSNTWLSESVVGIDLNGNGTTTDDFPPQYHGLIHIIGSGNSTQISGNAFLQGCLITEAGLTTNAQSTFIADPNLYIHPPMGYGAGDQLAIVPGSWTWDSPP